MDCNRKRTKYQVVEVIRNKSHAADLKVQFRPEWKNQMNAHPDCGNHVVKTKGIECGSRLGRLPCEMTWEKWKITGTIRLADQARYPIQDRSFVAHGRSWMPCAPAEIAIK